MASTEGASQVSKPTRAGSGVGGGGGGGLPPVRGGKAGVDGGFALSDVDEVVMTVVAVGAVVAGAWVADADTGATADAWTALRDARPPTRSSALNRAVTASAVVEPLAPVELVEGAAELVAVVAGLVGTGAATTCAAAASR